MISPTALAFLLFVTLQGGVDDYLRATEVGKPVTSVTALIGSEKASKCLNDAFRQCFLLDVTSKIKKLDFYWNSKGIISNSKLYLRLTKNEKEAVLRSLIAKFGSPTEEASTKDSVMIGVKWELKSMEIRLRNYADDAYFIEYIGFDVSD